MKRWKWILCMPLLLAFLIMIIIMGEPEQTGISRAMAAKSVALAVLPENVEDIQKWQKEQSDSRFSIGESQEWYAPYLNYLYNKGYITEEAWPATSDFMEGNLTYADGKALLDGASEVAGRKIRLTKKNQGKKLPQNEWWELYEALLKEVDEGQLVKKETLKIYSTPQNVPQTPSWTANTNKGAMRFYGLSLDTWIGHQILVYVRNKDIIRVVQDDGTDITFSNVWIVDATNEELTIYQGGITRQISLAKKIKKPEKLIHCLADLDMSRGQVEKVRVKDDTITGKVLSVSEEGIELEEYGFVPFDEEYQIFKAYGELAPETLEDILVGYNREEFVVAKGKICAALTVREFDAQIIRVLLMTEGFLGIHHEQLELSWVGKVKQIQETEESLLENEEGLILKTGDAVFKKGRLILEPQEGEICVKSLNRALGKPSYGGRLEIVDTEDGLILVNELYLEDYLKKVVPSEMPSSYEKEALKAQAVCARTYAYMQIQSNTYSQYGAHVDDSTNFQVYNNIASDGKTAQAVDETYGKLLFYEGNPIMAYYFSTSCGTTTDTSVWGSEPEDTPYLKPVTLQPSRRSVNISDDNDFLAFIKKKDFSAYDSSFPFFRWNVNTNGEVLAKNIDGVGTVTEAYITERSESGMAKKLFVKGIEGEKTISGQNAIRAALGDTSLIIYRNDDNTTQGWSSLPSGFLALENLGENDEGIVEFKIYGGGYGHGVGMSQNGAQGMAKEGLDYESILTFFYDGVSVKEIK